MFITEPFLELFKLTFDLFLALSFSLIFNVISKDSFHFYSTFKKDYKKIINRKKA